MPDLAPDDPDVPLKWTDRILKTADTTAQATTGALFAAAFMSVPLGIVLGPLGWVPCLGFTGALVHRGIKYYVERDIRAVEHQLKIQEKIRTELEAIQNSPNLSAEQKKQLSDNVLTAGKTSAQDNNLLPP